MTRRKPLDPNSIGYHRIAKPFESVMWKIFEQLRTPIAHLRAARHWTSVSGRKRPSRLRWWESQLIVQHVNEKICGQPVAELGAASPILIKQRFPGRTFPRAVSIGCGTGEKEMFLIQAGLVEEFHLFELSKARVEQGIDLAKRLGLSKNVRFFNRNGLTSTTPRSYDLVHWNNSLHHMLNVDQAIRWSRDVLRPAGLFFMDDFVGPDRMQWSSKMLSMASRVRTALPDRCLQDPRRAGRSLRRRLRKPNRMMMLISDPTECADSARILPIIKTVFPNAEIRPMGGVIYHLALNDVLHNLDEDADRDLLEQLLRIDDICTRLGEYHYAVAVAEKST